ncbi:hypothetical protein Aoki45_00190 [Algoriphagus sp. oki45]|nr:hypothetical protein Aoki45_00190 [Algoriphagus sp. oki45]
MIGHKTVCIGIQHLIQMLCIVLEEETIILLLPENILGSNSEFVDFVRLAGFQVPFLMNYA